MTSTRPSAIRLIVAGLAVGGGLVAQQVVHADRASWLGWALFALAGVVLALVVSPSRVAPAASVPASAGRGTVSALLAVVALLCVAGTSVLSAQDRLHVLALMLWLLALVAGLIAARGWIVSPPRREPVPWTSLELTGLALILAGSAAARMLWIREVPPYYFGDEPRVGVFLIQAFGDGRIPNFFRLGWNTWPVIGLSLQGLFAPAVGLNTTALRLGSAFFGTVSVLATYLLARELFSRRTAVFAAIVVGVCRTALDFSRMGICHAQVMAFIPLAFYFWWRGVNSGKAVAYVAAGIALGLCYYTYNAGHIALPMWAAWLGLCAVCAPRTALSHWRGALITAAGFVLVSLPLMLYVTDSFQFGQHWFEWTYMSRLRQTGTRMVEAWNTQGLDAALTILKQQVWFTWLGFSVIPSDAYGLGYRGGGMFDRVSGPLFTLGLVLVVSRIARARYAFLFVWWLLTCIVGGVLTEAPPAFVRLVGVIPAAGIVAALALDYLWQAAGDWRPARAAAGVATAAVLSAAAWDNATTYFVRFPRESFDHLSELAHAVNRLPEDATVALLGAEHYLHFNQELFALDFADRDLTDVGEVAHYLPVHRPISHALGLILGPTQTGLTPYIQALYPSAVVSDVVRGVEQRFILRTVEVSHEELLARAGLQLRHGDDEVVTADPFAVDLPRAAGDGATLHWRGGIYWPTAREARVEIESATPVTLTIGEQRVALAEPGKTAAEVRLPRGWLPVAIEERFTGRMRSLRLQACDITGCRALTRWDFRPDSEWHGLQAEYETAEGPQRVIEPQINLYVVEAVVRPERIPVRAPFLFSARGQLVVEHPGPYTFEVNTTGPFRIQLDGTPLFDEPKIDPEQARPLRAERVLRAGNHAIEVWHDARHMPHTTRRVFQLSWTPPGGTPELVPPGAFRP